MNAALNCRGQLSGLAVMFSRATMDFHESLLTSLWNISQPRKRRSVAAGDRHASPMNHRPPPSSSVMAAVDQPSTSIST